MRRYGFTLIELLVVIAIIAILAAILFPTFLSAKEHATRSACLSNLRELTSATQMYADDNGGRFPETATDRSNFTVPDWCGCPVVFSPSVDPRKGSIWKYTGKSVGLYICGADRNMKARHITGQPTNYPISYAMNWSLRLLNADAVQGKATKVMLFIHQGRDSIDNGDFAYSSVYDLPKSVHNNGTTLSYVDGHARWAGYDQLVKEAAAWTVPAQ